MTTGEKIRMIRKAKGLTQKALGEALGVTQATIQQLESGKRNPKFNTLQRIADALNVPVEELISLDRKTNYVENGGVSMNFSKPFKVLLDDFEIKDVVAMQMTWNSKDENIGQNKVSAYYIVDGKERVLTASLDVFSFEQQ